MSKILVGFAGTALISVLVYQQYQIDQISVKVEEVTKLVVTQSEERLVMPGREEDCLAKNIYYEAGNESEKGKYAVAQVTINRLRSGKWGTTICSVVYAKAQFSWTLKKNLKEPSPNSRSWMDSQWVAHRVMQGARVVKLKKAMFYHADYVSPFWKEPLAKLQKVGRHIFYSRAKTAPTDTESS